MADSIQVKLPDGSVKEVPKGTNALDIAKSIGQRLADATGGQGAILRAVRTKLQRRSH